MKNTNRDSEALGSLFQSKFESNTDYLASIVSSPSDVGVMKNSGRSGARYAPEAIINRLKKFNNHFPVNKKILLSELTNQSSELKDFEKARKHASNKFNLLTHPSMTIHLGGGHDQIFPLLMGLDKNKDFKNIIILNIDAHCDTRIANEPNSGTPFRDFDTQGTKPFHLIQYGLQDYSNSKSTLTPLARGSEQKFFIEDIQATTEFFSKPHNNLFQKLPFKADQHTAVVFSLDCDGIDGSNMKAVSAVNPHGLPVNFVSQLAKQFFQTFPKSKNFYGIYEFNPVFDDSSLYSLKVISSLVFEILKFK